MEPTNARPGSNATPTDGDGVYFHESMTLWKNTLIRYLIPIETATTLIIVLAVLGSTTPPASGSTLAIVVAAVLGQLLIPSMIRLHTKIDAESLRVRTMFFWRTIRFEQMSSFSVVRYDALGQFGGWGYRKSRKHGAAYILAGEDGVRIETDKGPVTIGSFRVAELAETLEAEGVPRTA